MAARVALITGCSSGIGMDTALRLARRSKDPLIVYATMRNLAARDKLEEAAGDTLRSNLFVRELDVTKEYTITDTVSHIQSMHRRIDILINNAGIAGPCITEVTELETFKKMFEINFFGAVRLTQEVLPQMKRQMSGQIINISSIAGFMGFPFYEMYSSSKFALDGFTECMATSLRHFNIWVSSVQPGPTRSAMEHNPDVTDVLRAQVNDERADTLTRKMFREKLVARKATLENDSQPVEEISEVIERVVDADKPHLRYHTSDKVRDLAKDRYSDPDGDEWVESFYK